MVKTVNRLLGVMAAGLLSTGAIADDMDSRGFEVSGNVTLTSDYSFRGISQTTRDPAIQGGFDIETAVGFYAGTWASNVNFGSDTSTEIDIYVGFGGEIGDSGISYDVNYIRFEYPSEGDVLDYNEFAGSLGFAGFTLGYVYSNEYLAIDGASFNYPYAEYSFALPRDMALDLHVGYNDSDEIIFGDEDSYIDYSATLTIPVAGIDLGLAVVGTDLDAAGCGGDVDNCDDRVIVSLSKSL